MIKIKLEIIELDKYRNENLEITIYRVVQEALNNVAKHAGAKTVDIFLKREIKQITGFIQDDGKGFDIKRILEIGKDRHMGLLSMKERISTLGGALNIQTDKGRGTRIEIKIPC